MNTMKAVVFHGVNDIRVEEVARPRPKAGEAVIRITVTTNGTLTGMFGGSVTAAPGMVSTADDSIALTYPLPAVVCSLSVAALSDTYSMVTVNGTTVSGPNTAFSSATAATACASAGPTASVGMYATRN